jgi:putative FmdB family regulatory protein
MPIYAFKCPECEAKFDRMLKLADYDSPQKCPECEHGPCPRLVTKVNFNLPGDGWVSKNGRIRNQMTAKNARLNRLGDERKRDAPMVHLVPNVNGEETGTWKEAQKLAASKGKNPLSYTAKVNREKAGYK